MGRAVYTRTIRKPLDRCELTQTSPCKIRDTHTVCISQGHVSHRAGHVMARTFADGTGCGGSGITRRGWAPYRSQMYSITIQTQSMYCTFGVTARGWAPYH